MEIDKKEVIIYIILILVNSLLAGFYLGYDAHSNSLVNLADSYMQGNIIALEDGTVYGKTDCWERAFVLSAWLPFELTEDLQVKDCQEIEWLDSKFQKLYFLKGDK